MDREDHNDDHDPHTVYDQMTMTIMAMMTTIMVTMTMMIMTLIMTIMSKTMKGRP
jgi:hypothetical protein